MEFVAGGSILTIGGYGSFKFGFPHLGNVLYESGPGVGPAKIFNQLAGLSKGEIEPGYPGARLM